jgi:extradiol dioxygenase family protein
MLTAIIPRLPMRNRNITRAYYVEQLGFTYIRSDEVDHYLIVEKDGLQIHFFLHTQLDPNENDGQIYIRTDNVDVLFQSFVQRGVSIHPNGHLEDKPWKQREFALLDPDNNLLTFGQNKRS